MKKMKDAKVMAEQAVFKDPLNWFTWVQKAKLAFLRDKFPKMILSLNNAFYSTTPEDVFVEKEKLTALTVFVENFNLPQIELIEEEPSKIRIVHNIEYNSLGENNEMFSKVEEIVSNNTHFTPFGRKVYSFIVRTVKKTELQYIIDLKNDNFSSEQSRLDSFRVIF